MRLSLCLAIPVLCAAAAPCDNPFTSPVQPGSTLAIDVRPGDVEIRGADTDALQVTCSLKDGSPAKDISVNFRNGELNISGGSGDAYNSVRIRIDVPQKLGLRIRMSAGNLTVRDVTGEKDLELRAGNIEVLGRSAAEYRSVELSARAGNIEAPRYGIQRSGLFRSDRRSGLGGQYRLRAHVTAGNVTVR